MWGLPDDGDDEAYSRKVDLQKRRLLVYLRKKKQLPGNRIVVTIARHLTL